LIINIYKIPRKY